MGQLVPGDQFPIFSGLGLDGSKITIPTDLDAKPAIVLCYRGHW